MTAGVAPSRRESATAPALPSGQLDLLESAGLAPYRCRFCGALSWLHPVDQLPPSDYCHQGDHGEPDQSAGVVTPAEVSWVGLS